MIFIPCSDLQNPDFMAYWIVYVIHGHLASAAVLSVLDMVPNPIFPFLEHHVTPINNINL
jgi:hypothetical protein